MKKTATTVIATVLAAFLLIPLAFALGGQNDKPDIAFTAEKDGLRAWLTTSKNTDGKPETAQVRLDNLSSVYAEKITVSLSSSDGAVWVYTAPVALPTGNEPSASVAGNTAGPVDIAVGTDMTFTFLAQRTDTTTVGSEDKGCRTASRAGAAMISVISALGVALCFRSTKLTRRFFGILLVCVTVLAVATLPAGASDTVRSFTVSGESGGVTLTAEVSYHHNFKEKEVAGSTGMEKFEITYFWGPHGNDILNEEYIKAIADCGFTSIPIENNSIENNKAALKLLKKYGLTCSAMWDPRINHLVHTTENLTAEQVDATVKEVVDDYREFDNLRGYLLRDEPSAKHFPRLGMIVSAIRRLDPERSSMINLFPNTVSPGTLGSKTYAAHLDELCDIVDPHYISYDQYVLTEDGKCNPRFYDSLEKIRRAGLKHGKDYMQIILLTKHSNKNTHYADLTPTQITWEVNLDLVYGMKRISYFTFWMDKDLIDDGWTNSCMDYTGKKYQHYYDVQEINKWLLPLGRELFGKQSTAVYHLSEYPPSSSNRYTSYGDLGEVEGSDAVIGFFDDESFMIVNKNYRDGDDYRRSYTLIDHSDGLEYFNTASGKWETADGADFMTKNEQGKYVLTLNAAAGVLLRVKK